VLISDHRAIGASLAPSEWDMDLSHEGMALDVLHLVASLGKAWRSVDMLGWSMGGHILQVLLTLPSAKEAKQGGLDVEGIHVAHAILTGTMTVRRMCSMGIRAMALTRWLLEIAARRLPPGHDRRGVSEVALDRVRAACSPTAHRLQSCQGAKGPAQAHHVADVDGVP
jgi:pimeloyl-ACP methyl ester carboxylesterase